MENPSSPLETLRQLKEMLDAGALTPTEFEALKQRLVFAPAAPGPDATGPPASSGTPVALAAAAVPELPAPEATVAATAPVTPQHNPPAYPIASPPELPPATHEVAVEALVFEPVSEPMFMPEASADFPIAVGGPSYVEEEALADDDATDFADPPAERSSSLGLILAVGAVLVFLAVVAYLGFNRPTTDEHISSISQTAADSLNTTIETGPQVAPLPTTTAAPETVRVAPTNPAPIILSRPVAPTAADTIKRATNLPATDSVGNQ